MSPCTLEVKEPKNGSALNFCIHFQIQFLDSVCVYYNAPRTGADALTTIPTTNPVQ